MKVNQPRGSAEPLETLQLEMQEDIDPDSPSHTRTVIARALLAVGVVLTLGWIGLIGGVLVWLVVSLATVDPFNAPRGPSVEQPAKSEAARDEFIEYSFDGPEAVTSNPSSQKSYKPED